jgi:hypothetical protein
MPLVITDDQLDRGVAVLEDNLKEIFSSSKFEAK